MKVSGPNSGPGVGAPDGATGVAPGEATGPTEGNEGSGRAFAEKLEAAATPPAATTTPVARPAELDASAAIARDLDAGNLTPAGAVDRILEQVLAQQVGADAPPAVRERVRAALQDALENDPLLAEQLRRLGA